MKTDNQLLLEQTAINDLISFGLSNNNVASLELIKSINLALDVYSTNDNFAISHRKIAAKKLLINCISSLNKKQLEKVDKIVMNIAVNFYHGD